MHYQTCNCCSRSRRQPNAPSRRSTKPSTKPSPELSNLQELSEQKLAEEQQKLAEVNADIKALLRTVMAGDVTESQTELLTEGLKVYKGQQEFLQGRINNKEEELRTGRAMLLAQ